MNPQKIEIEILEPRFVERFLIEENNSFLRTSFLV